MFKGSHCTIALLLLSILSCRTLPDTSSSKIKVNEEPDIRVCAALRGNGDRILAHFGSLAQYHEHYPALQGMAGGSSASATTFIYESMAINPLLKTCESHLCSPTEKKLRLSFLLKSLMGYMEVYGDSEEVQALLYSIKGIQELRNIVADKNFIALIGTNPLKALQKLKFVLLSPEFRGILNSDLLSYFTITHPLRLRYQLEQFRTSVNDFGSFKVEDTNIFFFPGFFNWQEFAKRIGRMGDFYAGYGTYYPSQELEHVLSTCSQKMKGKLWEEPVDFDGNKSCQEEFNRLLAVYRIQNIADKNGPHRVQEKIGQQSISLASTAVIDDPYNVNAYQEALERYKSGADSKFVPNFSGIKLGYYGHSSTLQKISQNSRGYTDYRTKRFRALPDPTWSDILSTSPAEPSLSAIRPIRNDIYSLGGWIDLSPTLVLKNAGCDKVVYMTRMTSIKTPGFAADVAKILNSTPDELYEYISADPERQPPSSFSLSNLESDGVWCTDWDTPVTGDFKGQFKAGYEGKLLSDDAYFRSGPEPYSRVEAGRGRAACVVP